VLGYVLSIYLFKKSSGRKTATLLLRTGQKIKIRLSNIFDLCSVLEVFQRKIYTPKIFRIPDKATIVDIGASIGDFSIFCVSSFSNCNCYALEPDRSAYDLCTENVLLNNMNNRIRIYPLAVSDQCNEIKTGDNVHKSVSMEKLFNENSIDKCDLLKMDIEGAEYKTLLNTPLEILQRVNAIAMECHIFDNVEQLSALKGYLSESNLQVITTEITAHNICYLYAYRKEVAI